MSKMGKLTPIQRKIVKDIVRFMINTEKKAHELNDKYIYHFGLYSSVLSDIGFSRDNLDYYKKVLLENN